MRNGTISRTELRNGTISRTEMHTGTMEMRFDMISRTEIRSGTHHMQHLRTARRHGIVATRTSPRDGPSRRTVSPSADQRAISISHPISPALNSTAATSSPASLPDRISHWR